jgi:hypothetical protein
MGMVTRNNTVKGLESKPARPITTLLTRSGSTLNFAAHDCVQVSYDLLWIDHIIMERNQEVA